MDTLEKALKEREDFLNSHPNMKEYQEYIDSIMLKISNPEGRLEALAILIEGKQIEFQLLINKLSKIFKDIEDAKN